MNALTNKKYYSKLLLFGEYTVINGGQALAIPFKNYYGQWKYGKNDNNLDGFFQFALTLENAQKDQLVKAVSEDLYFDSTIPVGYGCGSSGALTAGVYDQFFTHKQFGTVELKHKLAEIESYFHGKSSGLDPLVCYLDKAIWVKGTDIHVLNIAPDVGGLFLIDAKEKRKTSHWVKVFLDKQKRCNDFRNALQQLEKLNTQAISAMILGDKTNLLSCFRSISQLQRDHFEEMIPLQIKKIWDHGLKSGLYALKLSGAGGGGFFLGMGTKPDKGFYLA